MSKTKTSEQLAANDEAKRVKQAAENMTPAEIDREVKELNRHMANYAPTMESVESDLLKAFQLLALKFVERYYPDCTDCSLYLACYPEGGKGTPEYHAHIPLATKARS